MDKATKWTGIASVAFLIVSVGSIIAAAPKPVATAPIPKPVLDTTRRVYISSGTVFCSQHVVVAAYDDGLRELGPMTGITRMYDVFRHPPRGCERADRPTEVYLHKEQPSEAIKKTWTAISKAPGGRGHIYLVFTQSLRN